MAGTLYHGRLFEKDEYTGNDGASHYEVIPVDGGTDVISISNWRAIVDYCSQAGITEECWPSFNDAFDIPLETVKQKCAVLREKLRQLEGLASKEEVPHPLEKVIHYLNKGEQIFFAEE